MGKAAAAAHVPGARTLTPGRPTMLRTLRSSLLALTLIPFSPGAVEAQSPTFLTGLGYGTVGAVAGAYATRNATCSGSDWICIPGEAVVATLGGLALGAGLGAALSGAANRRVAEGEPLDGAHLAALSVGTVLGGATVGLVLGAALADRTGTNTSTSYAALSALAGATYGIVRLRHGWGLLTGNGVELRPAVLDGGRPGLVASLGF